MLDFLLILPKYHAPPSMSITSPEKPVRIAGSLI